MEKLKLAAETIDNLIFFIMAIAGALTFFGAISKQTPDGWMVTLSIITLATLWRIRYWAFKIATRKE